MAKSYVYVIQSSLTDSYATLDKDSFTGKLMARAVEDRKDALHLGRERDAQKFHSLLFSGPLSGHWVVRKFAR